VGKVNWTVVAISAGVTLGASVAVLSTSDGTLDAGGGQIIVPQSAPGDDTVRPPVRIGQPQQPAPPPVVSVVAVNPAGYMVTPPPPVVTPPPPPVITPVVKVNVSVSLTPGRLIRSTTSSTSKFVSQVIGLSPNSWSGWFSQPDTTSRSTWSVSSLSTSAKVSATSTVGGRHRAGSQDGGGRNGGSRNGGGGRHHR
jgi:uncharacterized membrane protein YgcG